ncbi:aspartokinase [Vibrio astriarenae]|nr:aspartokinase [Vibrio sp. C7]
MSTFNVAKFGGTSVANFEAMSRCASIIESHPSTRLVVSSACSGVTNLLVELANGIQDQEQRTSVLQQLADIHEAILSKLENGAEAASEVYAILDTVTSLAEAASIQSSTKLTDHLVACGELMSTHILAH